MGTPDRAGRPVEVKVGDRITTTDQTLPGVWVVEFIVSGPNMRTFLRLVRGPDDYRQTWIPIDLMNHVEGRS